MLISFNFLFYSHTYPICDDDEMLLKRASVRAEKSSSGKEQLAKKKEERCLCKFPATHFIKKLFSSIFVHDEKVERRDTEVCQMAMAKNFDANSHM